MSVLSLKPYKHLSRLIQNESFEPLLLWGARMAISAMLPMIWGLATKHLNESIWITLTAECLCWIELKGSYAWRLRVLAAGGVLALIFSVLGSVTSNSVGLSIICMFGVGFLASVLKNIGDRANGLSISVYLLFIFCNAYPCNSVTEIKTRTILVLAGAAWTILVGMLVSLFMPAEQPYRRYIALIWRAISALVETVGKGWEGSEQRINIRQVYLKEKDVRAAIDNSYQFYGKMAHQVSRQDKKQYALAQLRKATGLVAAHVITMSEDMEALKLKDIDSSLRIKLSSLLRAIESTAERMSVYVISLKGEEELLVITHISRLKKLVQLIKEYPAKGEQQEVVQRIIHIAERSIKLVESAMNSIEQMGEDRSVFRSYSLMKTLFILHPKYWIRNLRLLLNFNTLTTRYALRVAIAASLALFIYKWFHIDHGYWLPFSVMIVIQPYFGATFKKAIDRVLGTVSGGLIGGLLLHFPAHLHVQEFILFLSFIFMVYYMRKKYAIAAFVITLNLVLLFNIESALNPTLIITRALCTIGGASLAVIAGFALLPTWDKKWLPRHLMDAINSNHVYFTATFFADDKKTSWTRLKRNAETGNSNVFDSFNRYMEDPVSKENASLYFDVITHNIRITRYMNSIHLEEDNKVYEPLNRATPKQQEKINECLHWFNKITKMRTSKNEEEKTKSTNDSEEFLSPLKLSRNQEVYLEKILIELKAMQSDLLKLNGQ